MQEHCSLLIHFTSLIMTRNLTTTYDFGHLVLEARSHYTIPHFAKVKIRSNFTRTAIVIKK